MSIELRSPRPGFREVVVKQMLHRIKPSGPSVDSFSKKARERREAYERPDARTYIGNVYLRPEQEGPGSGEQDWSFQEKAPVVPPNPEPNVSYGDHALHSGDYLTIFNSDDGSQVVWEGLIDLYTKGIRDPQGKHWGLVHQRGVDEGDFFGWFSGNYRAELRTSVKPVRSATAGEAAGLHEKVSGQEQPQALTAAA